MFANIDLGIKIYNIVSRQGGVRNFITLGTLRKGSRIMTVVIVVIAVICRKDFVVVRIYSYLY